MHSSSSDRLLQHRALMMLAVVMAFWTGNSPLLILGERLEGFHLAGMAFILGVIAVSMLGLRRKESAGVDQGGRIEGTT